LWWDRRAMKAPTSRLCALLVSLSVAGSAAAYTQPTTPGGSAAPDEAAYLDMWKKLPPLRPTPPTARTLELAHRLLELQTIGLTDEAIARRTAAVLAPVFKSPPDLGDAMIQAIRENPDLLSKSRARNAEVFAKNYTDEELEALIGLLSDPLGQVIHQKRLAAIGGRPIYTREEQAWIDEREGGEIGRSLQQKKLQVGMAATLASLEFNLETARRAAVIYCKRNACSEETKKRIAAGL
jgi:hypothetical protein